MTSQERMVGPGQWMQLDLLPMTPPQAPRTGRVPGGAAEFLLFHEANPHIYENLRRLALEVVRAGHTKFGMRLLWERLRWEYMVHTKHREGEYRLNDHYVPHYARMLTEREPELVDVFELRALRAEPAATADRWRRREV